MACRNSRTRRGRVPALGLVQNTLSAIAVGSAQDLCAPPPPWGGGGGVPRTASALRPFREMPEGVEAGNLFDVEQNPFQSLVAQHVASADAQDRYRSSCQPCLTMLILVLLRGSIVCERIHLNRQPGRRTIEIEDVGSDGCCRRKRKPTRPAFRRTCHSTTSGKLILRRNSRARRNDLFGARKPPPPCFAWSPSPAVRGRNYLRPAQLPGESAPGGVLAEDALQRAAVHLETAGGFRHVAVT